MARKALPPAEAHGPEFSGATPAEFVEQEGRVYLAEREHDAQLVNLARELRYPLPEDGLDPEYLCREAARRLRHGAEACLDAGRCLVLLKAVCPHGEFTSRVETLGIEPRLARRMMQAARKFSRSATTANLAKITGSQTKLFELLVWDDEEIDELALIGQDGGGALDKITTAGLRDLRKMLASNHQDSAAKDKRISELKGKLDAAEEKSFFVRNAPVDEAEKALRIEAQGIAIDIESHITTRLRPAFAQLAGCTTVDHRRWMHDTARNLVALINTLAQEHNVDDAPDEIPAWADPEKFAAAEAEIVKDLNAIAARNGFDPRGAAGN